jgi:Glycosyltransferase family 87
MLAWAQTSEFDTDRAGPTHRAVREIKLHKPRLRMMIITLLCIGFSFLSSILWSREFRATYGGTNRLDLGEIYYGARTAMHHQDPYNPDAVLNSFRADGGKFPSSGAWATAIIIGVEVNLPTTLFLTVPLALLSYSVAQAVWIGLTIVLLSLAGYAIWTLADSGGRMIAGCLLCIVLTNSQQMFMVGNVAGIVVSLCILAGWCFLKDRYVPLAVVLLAVSLAFKPHDAGFVWLYFLLAGGVMRKRALQTLALTGAIGLAAAMWMHPVSPHWLQELHVNHVAVAGVGSTSDPSMAGITSGNVGAILDLQAAMSFISSNPRFYNMATYLIVGPLIAGWGWVVIRRRMTTDTALLALAAIAVLSLLPVYHRPYDAKLLLLTLPACAKLWSQGGARRWLSFGFTTAGILLTSDIVQALIVCSFVKPVMAALPAHKVVALSLVPPLALLAMGCFYLWAFINNNSAESESIATHSANELMALSAAS